MPRWKTQLIRNMTLEVTYTGTKGTRLDLLRYPKSLHRRRNKPTRMISNAANFTYDQSNASSIYHAFSSARHSPHVARIHDRR